MREQFCNELLLKISDLVDSNTLKIISQILSVHVDDYEISKRNTEIAEYQQIPDQVKIYLVSRKVEGLAQSTLGMYGRRLKNFFDMVKVPLNEISANDVRVFLFRYQQKSGCSDRTLDGIRTVVSSFFKWANCEGYIDSNPCANIKTIKYVKTQRGFLTETEMELMRGACKTKREKAVVEFFCTTGCRVSELTNVKLSDINFNTSEVVLFGKGSKYRTNFTSPRANILIKDYISSRHDNSPYLFVSSRSPHNKLTKESVERMIRKIGRDAGIEKRVYPHLLRHSVATLAVKRGMDITEVQKILGHENINTTMIYASVSDESVKMSHRRCVI